LLERRFNVLHKDLANDRQFDVFRDGLQLEQLSVPYFVRVAAHAQGQLERMQRLESVGSLGQFLCFLSVTATTNIAGCAYGRCLR
jgi:hypothetical protein